MKETQWVDALANAGFLYGPFFFAILFIVVITRTAHSYYAKVCARTEPPPSAQECADYRFFFRGSVYCGIVLAFIAVAWWMFAQVRGNTYYEGAIVGLDPDLTITPTEDRVFVRAVERQAGAIKVRDFYFVVVGTTPFAPGEEFRFGLFDTPGQIGDKRPEPKQLVIKNSGKRAERYFLTKDDKGYKLVRVGS